MKKLLSLLMICVLLLSVAAVPSEAVESDLRFRLRSLDITLTPDHTLRIGEGADVTWSVAFTTGQNSTTLTYLPEMSHINLKGDPDNNFHLSTSNTLAVELCFECYVGPNAQFTGHEKFAFTFNAQPLTLEAHQLYLEQDWGAPPILTEDGMELYRYLLRLELSDIPYTLPEAPTYTFTAAENPLIYDYGLDSLPRYAQAGAKIDFPPFVSVGSHLNELTDILCNGQSIGVDFCEYTMPDRDVVIEYVVGAGDGSADSTLIKDLKIDLNFPKDIYYGRTLPTTADLQKALNFSTSVFGADLYLDMVDVDTLFDDLLGENQDPWVGNTFLSFVIKAKEGFVFTDGAFADLDEMTKWQNENVKITLNGQQNYYGTVKSQDYYNGYMVSDYLLSDRNGIELHIFWYGGMKLDMDTSGYKAGDTVIVPENCFQYDGYIPYCYDYTYTTPDGQTIRERAMGDRFVHPETDGTPIEIYVIYVRGEDKSPAQSITQDAAETVQISTGSAIFPSGTILSVDLVQSSDQGGQATIDHVKKALSGHATDCLVLDISASAFNQAVQPTGKVLVSFDLPQGYDKDHVDFCYISDDGSMERIPMEIDPVTGKCIAALEHFSLYAIVKTVEKTEHTEHSIHTDGNGDGQCDGCAKFVEAVKPPVNDPGVQPPDSPTSPTDPATPEGSQPTTPTGDGQLIAGTETGPADLNISPAPAGNSGNGLVWLIFGGIAALLIAAAVLLLVLQRKRK